jgi:hypothetical protein
MHGLVDSIAKFGMKRSSNIAAKANSLGRLKP